MISVARSSVAESLIGLYKTELIRRRGPWRGLDDVEFATLEYVDWWNHRRLHGAAGMIPPAEAETTFYRQATPALEATTQWPEPPRNPGRFTPRDEHAFAIGLHRPHQIRGPS